MRKMPEKRIPFVTQLNGSYNIDPSTNATALLEDCGCLLDGLNSLLQSEAESESFDNVFTALYLVEMTSRAVELQSAKPA